MNGIIITEDNIDDIFNAIENNETVETEELVIFDDTLMTKKWADFYKSFCDKKVEEEKLSDEDIKEKIITIKNKIKKEKEIIKDWKSRVYKNNTRRVSSNFDKHNETGRDYSVNSINERRRNRVIMCSKLTIDELKNELMKLRSFLK